MTIEDPLLPTYDEPLDAVLLFGPPGVGKGTLGKFLSAAGNHVHLSSGDIFRSLPHNSPAGKVFYQYAGHGRLVPDEITIKIWHHYVQGLIATNRYFPKEQLILLDGIPRTVHQAKLLEKYLNVKKIIVLEVENPEELTNRVRGRAIKEERSDDLDPKVFQTRMEVYQETLKVLDHYPENLITRFDASQKPLEVLRDVLVALSPILCR